MERIGPEEAAINFLDPLCERNLESPFPYLSIFYQSIRKVGPYTFIRRGVPVREDTYAEPSACEVGWPVPFLGTLISPVLPPGTHLLLGEQ